MRLFLSDIADMLMSPLLWAMALLVLGLLAKKAHRRKRRLIISISILVLFSNAFLIDRLLSWWERDPVRVSQTYDQCIILSGEILDFDAEQDRDVFRCGSDRFLQGVRLYKQGSVRSLYFSGRSGGRGMSDFDEAGRLDIFARMIGVKCDHESVSRTTWENAQECAKHMHADEKLLLITSASHMRRAEACFHKAGLDIDIYPVGHMAGPPRPGLLFRFETISLLKWRILLHEMAGYIIYKARGKA